MRWPWLAPLALTGCLKLLPAPIPMESVADPFDGGTRARCLLVLLPGAADRATVFRDQGFIETIQRTGLSVDALSADATPGYYYRGIAAQRIETDVVAPARAKGYEQVWVLG